MLEAFQRWKTFPREIEADLAREYGIDIGDWFEGRLSSRRFIVLTDGLLPDQSWYKQALAKYMEQSRLIAEDEVTNQVGSLIFAQLTGQSMEVPNGSAA